VLTTYYVKDQSGARLRVEPNASSKILRVIPMNTRINAAPSGRGNWYSVEVDGERGYVDASLIGTERVTVTRPQPAPQVASKPRPGTVPIIKVAPQARKPKTILEKQYAAVAAQKTFDDIRAANRTNWSAALDAAYESLLF
jgi:LDH2 family malate/lactate/ureidoglycolate dehydrogenase